MNDFVGKITPPVKGFADDPRQVIGTVLSVTLKVFFIIAGVTALYFLFWGTFDWITSGGDKEKVSTARQRIGNAVLGIALIFVVLAIIATLEKFVFKENFCFGLTCPIIIPSIK